MGEKKQFVESLFWASSGSILAKLIDFVTLIALARLLDPTTFGLIAIALLVTNALNLFSDLGLGTALIQKRRATEEDNNTVFLATPILNIFIYAIAYVMAKQAGVFFNNGDVALIIKVLSLILIIQSLGTVPSALLQKGLKYKSLLIVDVTASATYLIVAVGLAYDGKGVWSIVIGQLARYSTHVVALWFVSGWSPGWSFQKDSFRSLYRFGKHIVILSVISFVFKNIDNAVIAKFLTPKDLGLYTMAYTIGGNIIPQVVKMTIGKIAFPIYSLWNEDPSIFKRRFILINRFNLIFCIWATLILITTSSIFVPMFLGEKWAGTILLIQFLALFGLQRGIASVCAPALNAAGVPQAQREPMLLNSLIFVPLVIPAAKFFGVKGVALLATISIIPGFVWTIQRTFKLLNLQEELLRFFYPVLLGGFSLSIWILLRPYVCNIPFWNLAASLFLVSVIFLGIMWVLEKELFKQIYRIRGFIRDVV
jgi:O-antigen/teichoic acid export membrane protein